MKLLKVMPFVVSAVLLIPLKSYADDEPQTASQALGLSVDGRWK
jgi:hypothetical protein